MFLKRYAKLSILSVLLLPSLAFAQAAPKIADRECLLCHSRPDIHQTLPDGLLRSLYVNPSEWSQDVHRKSRMFCVDCHLSATPFLHFREGFPRVDCASCHPEEEEEYTKNIHFEYRNVSPNKELPQCYDCHTKHHVLLHDHAESSVHEENVGRTCGQCHAEVMIKGILKGTNLGKISGHRKGDLSEEFDMNVCISCHYKDSAHGPKRAYKEFCARCHNPGKKGDAVMGPTHLNSFRWTGFNVLGSTLSFVLLLGLGSYIGFRSRKKIFKSFRNWLDEMKVKKTEAQGSSIPEEKDTIRTEDSIDLTDHTHPDEK